MSQNSGRNEPPSMAAGVAMTLRRQIARGDIAVGEMLPAEHLLMERFEVARPTCREALRILQSEGLVRILRGNRGGAKVTQPDPTQIASYANVFLQMKNATITEVFNARIVIEPAAVELLAQAPPNEVLSELAQNAAAHYYVLEDRPAFYRHGKAFRQIMMDNCGSETLRLMGLIIGEISDSQLSLLSEILPHDEGEIARFRHSIGIKEKLIKAMEARQAERAAELWRRYLRLYLEQLHIHTPPELANMKPFPLG